MCGSNLCPACPIPEILVKFEVLQNFPFASLFVTSRHLSSLTSSLVREPPRVTEKVKQLHFFTLKKTEDK
jgi:hypothetical protein